MPAFEYEFEYAKSGRSACKQCKAKIAQGEVRIGLKALAGDADEGAKSDHVADAVKWHHACCFQRVRQTPWFKKNLPATPESTKGFEDLRKEDQDKVCAIFLACRGEGAAVVADADAAAAPTPTPPKKRGRPGKADASEDQSTQKAAKTEALLPSTPAMTEAEAKSIEAAKAELASKNVAFFGALLAKNGLPKSGRKEELLERVAECKVLGVPPTCTTCNKVRLKWSKATGNFSCPGFFDDESKHFKKCKGPEAGAEIVRTAWVDVGL